MPMQPRPSAETLRPLRPSSRIGIMTPPVKDKIKGWPAPHRLPSKTDAATLADDGGILESFGAAAHISWRSAGGTSMSQVAAWFGRKFEFSFPVELYPNLLARLRGTPARLEETLCRRSHDELTRKPETRWSTQEHAGHLLD